MSDTQYSTSASHWPGRDSVIDEGCVLPETGNDVSLILSWTLSKGHLSGIPGHNISSTWIVKSRPRMGNSMYKRVKITVETHNTGHR